MGPYKYRGMNDASRVAREILGGPAGAGVESPSSGDVGELVLRRASVDLMTLKSLHNVDAHFTNAVCATGTLVIVLAGAASMFGIRALLGEQVEVPQTWTISLVILGVMSYVVFQVAYGLLLRKKTLALRQTLGLD